MSIEINEETERKWRDEFEQLVQDRNEDIEPALSLKRWVEPVFSHEYQSGEVWLAFEFYYKARRASQIEIERLSTEDTFNKIIIKEQSEQIKKLKEVLEDLKEHGTRHDLNPTGVIKLCGCFDSLAGDHWQSYIKSQDSYVREKAREALKEVADDR